MLVTLALWGVALGTFTGIRGRWRNPSHRAVISDARHRQRRRRSRIALASVLALALLGWALHGFEAAHRAPASPRPSVPLFTADVRLGGSRSMSSPLARRSGPFLHAEVFGCPVGFGELSEISTRSGRVIKQFPVVDPQALAVGAGVVWLAHFYTSTVTRLDPRSGRTTATIHLVLPRPVVRNDRRFLPDSISVGGGAVWVSTDRGQIAKLDPRTLRLEAMVPSPAEQSDVIAGRYGSTWAADNLAGFGVVTPAPISSPSSRFDSWSRSRRRGSRCRGRIDLGVRLVSRPKRDRRERHERRHRPRSAKPSDGEPMAHPRRRRFDRL